MPYIIYHPNGDVTMPDELPIQQTVNEQIEPAAPEETPEEADDWESEFEAAMGELYGRLDACERELAELRGERHDDGNRREETSEAPPAESPGDREPKAAHFWFREIKRRE